MSRTHTQQQAFKVAEIQQKRADRADERLAEVRRELAAVKQALALAQREAESQWFERDEMRRQLEEAHADCRHMRIACHEASERLDQQQAEHFALETLRRRDDNARPLWRIAAERFSAWLRHLCR